MTCTRKPALIVPALGMLLMTLAATGCGRAPDVAGDSALSTAEAFAAALEEGDYLRAAGAFDYVTEARQQNENWDDIPPGQRDLIIKRLMEGRSGELQGYRERLGGSVQAKATGGNTVSLSGDAGTINLQLHEMEGKWLIRQVW